MPLRSPLVLVSFLLFSFFVSPALAQLNPGQGINLTLGNNQPRPNGIESSQVANKSQKEGLYVEEVWLDLRLMNATEAESNGDFYLGFPTLDRRHQYRYLTRRNDGGLRLRFTSRRGERRQTFHWKLQGQPGDGNCPLTQCDLPQVPVSDMELVEIHTEGPSTPAGDPLGIERGVVTYQLSNGELRSVELTNLWVPYPEISTTSSPQERISRITVVLRRNKETSSLGRQVKGNLQLTPTISLPLATQNSAGEALQGLTYNFLETNEAYDSWKANLPDYLFWPLAQSGCRASRGWTSGSRERCEEEVNQQRPKRGENPSAWIDQGCQNEYSPYCRYRPLPTSPPVDFSKLNIELNMDYDGWYGWNQELDPVHIDGINLTFEKGNGETFTVSENAGYSLPCSNASQCEIKSDPATIWEGQTNTVSWKYTGHPGNVNHNLLNVCQGWSGHWPDPDDAKLPMEGKAECRAIGSYSFDLDVSWSCPEISPNGSQIGVHYKNAYTTQHCEAPMESRGSTEIEDSQGCRYAVNGFDEQHPVSFGLTTTNDYIDKFGADYDKWNNLTPQYAYYQSRNALKRLLNAIHFLKSRQWENNNLEVTPGERISNDYFYQFAGTPIDETNPKNQCEWDSLARMSRGGWFSDDVTTLAKKLIFSQSLVDRATVLVHESWHIYSHTSHVNCHDGSGNSSGACDYSWDSNGAYGTGVSFLSWIYGECANCSPLIREYAKGSGNIQLDLQFYVDPRFRL